MPGLEQRRAREGGGLAPGLEATLGIVGGELSLFDAAIGDLGDDFARGGRAQGIAARVVGVEANDRGGIVSVVSGRFERCELILKRR